jgi:hypothetical protein
MCLGFLQLIFLARAGIIGTPAVVVPGAAAPLAYAAPAVAKVAAVDTDYDPNP